MAIKVVADNSPDDIARHHAAQKLKWAGRELAANMLRVIRGAGKPYMLAEHAVDYVKATQAYHDACGEWPSSDLVTGIFDPENARLEYRPWTADLAYDDFHLAKVAICKAALQIVASTLVDQGPQQSSGEHALSDALRERDAAIERYHKTLGTKPARRKNTKADDKGMVEL